MPEEENGGEGEESPVELSQLRGQPYSVRVATQWEGRLWRESRDAQSTKQKSKRIWDNTEGEVAFL